MKNTNKTKLVVLLVFLVIVAAGAAAIYSLTRPETRETEETLVTESLRQDEAEDTPVTETGQLSETETSDAVESRETEETNAGEAVSDALVFIQGGTFTMGSPESENWRETDEVQHEVTISDFYVDPYEVRQADYEAVMGENPSHFQEGDLPVENLTWYQAAEYCNRLSESNGLTPAYTIEDGTVTWDRSANGYRLLTEAEWEYAARAGTQTIYHFGDQIISDNANFEGSYPYNIETNYVNRTDSSVVTSQYRGETLPVDELPPNDFGLYNMHGNVSEWVFDYYGAYETDSVTDPVGAVSGALRVNRGGSYIDFGRHLRSAYRSATNPIDTDQNLGFRICRNAEGTDDVVTTTYDLEHSIPENPRILVAYFSYSGNTEEAAQIVADKTGGDLFEIMMAEPYSGNIYGVTAIDLDNDVRPELATHVEDMSQYDVILLGYPTWWATLPMPVVSFLEEYDFNGKTVASFSSHGGTMFGDSISDLSKLLPETYVGTGYQFEYSGSDSDAISAWLAENGVPER